MHTHTYIHTYIHTSTVNWDVWYLEVHDDLGFSRGQVDAAFAAAAHQDVEGVPGLALGDDAVPLLELHYIHT